MSKSLPSLKIKQYWLKFTAVCYILFNIHFNWSLFYFIIQLWIMSTKTIRFLNCGLIYAHFNYICILVLTTLKMTTWVAKTCCWPLHNEITSIKTKFVCAFNLAHQLDCWSEFVDQEQIMVKYNTCYFLLKLQNWE